MIDLPSERIPDEAKSQEHFYDKRFVQRWTNRCIEIRYKYGQEVANNFAREFLTPDIIRLVNKEIEERKKNGFS